MRWKCERNEKIISVSEKLNRALVERKRD